MCNDEVSPESKMMPPPFYPQDQAREIAVELLQTALNLLRRPPITVWKDQPPTIMEEEDA
jgi:hypothetical protein